MPSKKKKYNARFPAGRIKKIMQSDEEVGKVAQAVPVIISRTLELFVESLLTKTLRITNSRNAKTLSPSHMKQCIMSESRFDFLRELVKNIPDISVAEESGLDNSPETPSIYGIDQPPSFDPSKPSTSCGVIVRPTSTAANGMRISIDTRSISLASSSSSPQPLDCRTELKRQWDSMERTPPIISNSIAANFYKENSVIQHTSDSIEGIPPPKLSRTDSAPTPKTSYNSTSRRLQHQSKSIPCTSKDAGTPTTPQPPVVAPPPIVNIDLCNTPIVKIDYSNLALPDMEQIENPAKKHHKKHRRSSSLTTANSGGVCITPVINIDLSKIAASSSLTTPLPLELDEDDYDNI